MWTFTESAEIRYDILAPRSDDTGPLRFSPDEEPRRDNTDCGENSVEEFIEQSRNSVHENNKRRRVEKFHSFGLRYGLQATAESLARFLKEEIIGSNKEAYPTFSTVRNYVSAIDEFLIRRQLPTLGNQWAVMNFIEAARKMLPVSNPKFVDPGRVYNPRILIRAMLEDFKTEPSYELTRLLALTAFRSAALLRSKDVFSIRRSSIRATMDMRGKKILIFDYCGKLANILKAPSESNFLEFLSEDLAHVCPARWILKLKDEIDAINPGHDKIMTFVKDKKRILQPQSIGPIIKKYLEKKKIFGFTGHSLRGMCSEFLEVVAKVPGEEIQLRGWKARSSRPSARLLHYRSRITDSDFSNLLWNPNLLELNTLEHQFIITVGDEV